MSKEKFKHIFEPTDSEGHSMECVKCGKAISIYEANEWNMSLEEPCSKTVSRNRVLELAVEALKNFKSQCGSENEEIQEAIKLLSVEKDQFNTPFAEVYDKLYEQLEEDLSLCYNRPGLYSGTEIFNVPIGIVYDKDGKVGAIRMSKTNSIGSELDKAGNK